MRMQGIDAPSAVSTAKGSGLGYKVGLAIMATGIILMASSWLLGGVVFEAMMQLLKLLGAPEEREFLPSNEPEAGSAILDFLGSMILVCGA